VLTPNTGTSDFIQPGVNGEIVPIRDATAAAEAIVQCFERRRQDISAPGPSAVATTLSFDRFRCRLLDHLKTVDASSK
jgi:hypothetical protein